LSGEIIDPKCCFDAINPGQGKPHLSYAARCISGGIMPVLKYEVNKQYKNAVLAALHGVPIQITGKLYAMDNWEVLHFDTRNGIRFLY
jgi:hypothetical protein